MSLFVASINSGSNGNCYYVGSKQEAVLIDAGISCRETERRFKRLELSIKKVKAIFITHEHEDHIYGLSKLSRKFNIPVYITPATLQNSRLKLKENLIATFKPFEPIVVGGLSITAFPKFHDASDPYSFNISHNGVTVGVYTDIGATNDHLIYHFKQCHAAFLESNYDEKMLDTGSYPMSLKNRIRDGHGHLSNRQALQLFMNYRPSFMSHLFLAHLSENNNTPEIVKELFDGVAGGTEIIIAPRSCETPLYAIGHSLESVPGFSNLIAAKKAEQLSLF